MSLHLPRRRLLHLSTCLAKKEGDCFLSDVNIWGIQPGTESINKRWPGDPDRSEIEPKSNCQTQTQSAGLLARSESPMGAPAGSGVWTAFSSVLRAHLPRSDRV